MILIFSDISSPRLHYACEALFEDFVDGFQITHSKESFQAHLGPKICYDSILIDSSALHITPFEAIWHKEINRHLVTLGRRNGVTTIFTTECPFGFDVFAAVFYLLSRYEEYLPFKADRFGRYTAASFKKNIPEGLHQPLVDIWRIWLMEEIERIWPNEKKIQRSFSKRITIDVDSAFAYRYKGLKRTLGGFGRDISRGHWRNMMKRTKSLMGLNEDPFYTYDYILSKAHEANLELTMFFLLADFGGLDINVSHTSHELRLLIKRLSKIAKIGLHPGMASNDSVQTLSEEKRRLEEITGEPCHIARQHYLMLKFPETYRSLIRAGITEDYSMGFADDVGFRAGTSRPFYWYDLTRDEKTDLIIHSPAVMDSTLHIYLSLSPEQAKKKCSELAAEVKKVNGTFISIWHNDSVAEQRYWKGWRSVWEHIVQL